MRLVINNFKPRKETWKARSWINDWPSHNHSSARDDCFIARVNDSVRVVRLLSPTRRFSGTDWRLSGSQVGDVAIICEQYDPRDPTAALGVEIVDADGMTVWFADFLPMNWSLYIVPHGEHTAEHFTPADGGIRFSQFVAHRPGRR